MLARTGTAVVGLTVCALAGCNVQPQLVSAHSQQIGQAVIVEVVVPAKDAAKIKNQEMYTYVRVGDCQKMEDGFPAEAFVDGMAVSEFSFSTEGRLVRMSGSIPVRIFQKYHEPCATLEGGGYLSGVLVSAPQAVKIESAR